MTLEIKIGDYRATVPGEFKSPHKAGLVWHDGWEIPTLWALDSNKVAYVNDAHGGPLRQTRHSELLNLLRGKVDEAAVRRELGLKPRLPEWMAGALASGWTPPVTFKREDYE